VKTYHLLLSTLACPSALLLTPLKADATLTYNIFQDGSDVVVHASGALVLPASTGGGAVFSDAVILGPFAIIATGPSPANNLPTYGISGPTSFIGVSNGSGGATSASGTSTLLVGANSLFAIDANYLSGNTIQSSAFFANQTLAGLGYTMDGLIGTWTLTGQGYTANDQIRIEIGPPTASVPTSLPLLGVGAAFGSIRKLQKFSSQLRT